MFRKIFYNAAFQIAGKAFTATTTLIVTLLIGRSLGPDSLGDFIKAFVFVGYFYILVDFGANTIFVKLAKDQNTQPLFRSLLGLRLLVSFSLAAIAALLALILPYDPLAHIGFAPHVKLAIAIAALTIVTHGFFTTANAFFQKTLRYDLSTVAAIGGYLVILLFALIVFFQKGPFLAYVASYPVGMLVTSTIAYFLISQKFQKFFLPQFSASLSRKILKDAWPIGLALIFNLIYFRIDIFILANFRQSTEVGLYGLAYQFFEATLAAPIFFANSIYPVLVNNFRQNKILYQKQFTTWFWILLILSLFLAAILFTIANFLPLIYDARFQGSVAALQILSLGLPFFFLSALLWHRLIIHSQQKLLILIYGAGSLFNLLANLLFIPAYGFLAAATITVISEALILAMLAIAVFRIND